MCYGEMSLRDTVRDTEVRVARLAQAWNAAEPAAPVAPGWLARVRAAVAGWAGMADRQRAAE
jgi:hypothetical protein